MKKVWANQRKYVIKCPEPNCEQPFREGSYTTMNNIRKNRSDGTCMKCARKKKGRYKIKFHDFNKG